MFCVGSGTSNKSIAINLNNEGAEVAFTLSTIYVGPRTLNVDASMSDHTSAGSVGAGTVPMVPIPRQHHHADINKQTNKQLHTHTHAHTHTYTQQ